jgi:hypothetical protein
MTAVRRRRLATIGIILFNVGGILLDAMNLLEGDDLKRIVLVSGLGLVVMNLCMFYLRSRIDVSTELK